MDAHQQALTEPNPSEDHAFAEARHNIFRNLEEEWRHNSYEQELREFAAIESGDPDSLRKAVSEVSGSLGKLADTPVRNAKNLCIVCITLASRAAIRGGVSYETSYSLSDYYIQNVENLNCVDEILKFTRRAEYRFACLVRDSRHIHGERISVNQHTERCKRYIADHIRHPMTVKELADISGVSPNYLSALFLKNEGCTITEYILQEKISGVKHMLLYSDSTLAEIADCFGFTSQSHLGHRFKEYTGMTLKQYRNTFQT